MWGGIETRNCLIVLVWCPSTVTIDCYVTKRQLAWAGHLARMDFDRLPRKLLSSWVISNRPRGSPEFTYGRGLKKALCKADISWHVWHELAQDRTKWKSLLSNTSLWIDSIISIVFWDSLLLALFRIWLALWFPRSIYTLGRFLLLRTDHSLTH